MATADSTLLDVTPMLRPGAVIAKRLFDVAVASVAIVLLAPLLLALMVAVWIESPGNPIFVQERLGQFGRRFRLYKLRTMVLGAEQRRDEVEHLNESTWHSSRRAAIHASPGSAASYGRPALTSFRSWSTC